MQASMPGTYSHLRRHDITTAMQTGVYAAYFPRQQYTLTLRPVNPDKDIPLLTTWMMRQPGRHSVALMSQTYQYITRSDYIWPFLILLNDLPVSEIDLFRIDMDEMSLLYEDEPGDYGVRLLMAPFGLNMPDLCGCIIQTALQYFFLEDAVKRILRDPEQAMLPEATFWNASGFKELPHGCLADGETCLYGCARSYFQRFFPCRAIIPLAQS